MHGHRPAGQAGDRLPLPREDSGAEAGGLPGPHCCGNTHQKGLGTRVQVRTEGVGRCLCAPTILPHVPTLMLSNLAARSFRLEASSASHSRRAITRSRRQAPRAEATELEPWRERERGHSVVRARCEAWEGNNEKACDGERTEVNGVVQAKGSPRQMLPSPSRQGH